MAIYAGETVALRAQVVDPFTGLPLQGDTAEVELYAPGKNPARNPADRVVDVGPAQATFEANIGWVAYVPTDGFAAGRWTYRFRVVGSSFDTWEYGTFQVKA